MSSISKDSNVPLLIELIKKEDYEHCLMLLIDQLFSFFYVTFE
jgi:hypothetical protein